MQSMYYIGLDVHKNNDQLLPEGWQRPYSCRRRDSGNTIGSGRVDENASAAVDGGHGSDWIYDHLLPHADAVKVAHPLMLRAIAISSAFRPRVGSNCRMRWSFSVSAAGALLTQALPWLPVPFHPSSDRTNSERPWRRHVSETFPLLMPSCTICHFIFRGSIYAGFPAHFASRLEALILPN
jgi:hypothetical protein